MAKYPVSKIPDTDPTQGPTAELAPAVFIHGIGWIPKQAPNYQHVSTSGEGGPTAIWGKPLRRATAEEIKETAPKPPLQVLLSGQGARLALAYGHVALPGHLTAFGLDSFNRPVYQMSWCMGEINAVLNVYSGVTVVASNLTNYKGTQVQGVDPNLAAAISGYADTLLGVAYSSIKTDLKNGIKTFMAEVEARKCYDPRTSTTIYTQNPAIQFRDAAVLGGLQPDDDSISDTADECDALVGGSPRRQCNIYFDQPISIDEVLRTLAEYAGAFYLREGGVVKLIPDRPASVAVAFSEYAADTSKVQIKEDTLTLRKVSLANSPNRVITTWTDTSSWPWRVRPAATPVVAEDHRPTTFDMPGFHSFEEANRHSIERLNGFKLEDLEMEFEAFDDSLEVEAGDVITVASPLGLSDKPFRVTRVGAGEDIGHWIFIGREYQVLKYSNSVESAPSIPDVGGVTPDVIPIGPTPTVVERLFVEEGGRTLSRLDITWSGVEWPFVRAYQVEVLASGVPILTTTVTHKGSGSSHYAATGPVKQDVQYTVNIYLVNVFLTVGTLADTQLITAQGKLLLPQPVSQNSLVGFEFGYFVRVEHAPAADIDLVGYRYKRLEKSLYDAAANDAARWNHASVVLLRSKHDSPGDLFPGQPAGSYMYGVRSLDSVGQESATSAWVQVDVTDTNAAQLGYQQVSVDFASDVYGFERYGANIGGNCWVSAFTGDGGAFDDIFGTPRTNPFPADQTKAWCELEAFNFGSFIQTAQWDTGSDRAGVWFVRETDIVEHGGVGLFRDLYLKPDGGSFNNYPDGQALVARYAYGRIHAGVGYGGFTVREPVTLSFQGSLKSATQTVNVPASPQPHSFTWVNTLAAVPNYDYTVEGAEPVAVAFDNLTSSGGQIRVWAAEGHSTVTPGQPCAATIKLKEEGI